MEGEGNTLHSREEASNLLQEYGTSTITKFSCYSSDKGFGKIGKFLVQRFVIQIIQFEIRTIFSGQAFMKVFEEVPDEVGVSEDRGED